MLIEVTHRTEAPNTKSKATDATKVTPAVVTSVMGVVILIMGVVTVVVLRTNRYSLFLHAGYTAG